MENYRIVGDIMSIKMVYGDLLSSNANAILHQVNCKGVMGSGVAKQIRNKYPEVYREYTALCSEYKNYTSPLLGSIQSVRINESQDVVNLFGQNGYGRDKQHTNYDALRRCLSSVNTKYKENIVALPYKMGCGLGGGNWGVVYRIIEEELKDCEVYIYKLEKRTQK